MHKNFALRTERVGNSACLWQRHDDRQTDGPSRDLTAAPRLGAPRCTWWAPGWSGAPTGSGRSKVGLRPGASAPRSPPVAFVRSSRTTSPRCYILFGVERSRFRRSLSSRGSGSVFSDFGWLYLESARGISSRSKRGRMVFPEVIFRLPEHMPLHIPIIVFPGVFVCCFLVAFPVCEFFGSFVISKMF